jgi:hypothetical protein
MMRDAGLPFLKKTSSGANLVALKKLLNHWEKEDDSIQVCVHQEIKYRVLNRQR